VFGSALAISISYLVSINGPELFTLWLAFTKLSLQIRFCLAIVVISATYFGGAMYLAAPESAERVDVQNYTPASCDTCVEFDVPASLPADDKTLFEQMFNTYERILPISVWILCCPPSFAIRRLRTMILSDLPSLYEMPKEAVDWVATMIDYTVAGGKMNRGLALMSAYSTLKTAKGLSLTNKVTLFPVSYVSRLYNVYSNRKDASLLRSAGALSICKPFSWWPMM
jgi:hypothetical protein